MATTYSGLTLGPHPHLCGRRGAAGRPAGVSSEPHHLLRHPHPTHPPLPAQSREGDRKGEDWGGGPGAGRVCVSRRREETREGRAGAPGRGSARRARRAGGRRILLPGARSPLAPRWPGPRVTWGGRQVRTHWPPRRSAWRARPQAAAPSGGSARPLRPSPGPPPALAGPRCEVSAPGPGHCPRRTRRRRPGLTMVAARAECPRVAGHPGRSAG